MRPITHPSIESVTVEGILHVLSDVERASIFAKLAQTEGAICVDFLEVRGRDVPKSTLSYHFRALREAGLIRSERHGVEMRNATRSKELNQRFPGLIEAIMLAYQRQDADSFRDGGRRLRAAKSRVD